MGLAAVSISFFFINATTFTSLGVVLYAMSDALHWSQAAAGFSYSLLGLACGLTSPLPMLLVLHAGGRITLALGGLLLAAGFALAASSHGLWGFYAAMLLVGAGYSFAGNIPAVFLLSAWFPLKAARVNGLYMMTGALGSTAGPPLVELLLRIGGGWRGLWWVLAMLAAAIGLLCLLLVRATVPPADAEAAMPRGELWRSVRTLPFLRVASAITLTMMSLTTLSSIAMPTLTGFGTAPAAVTLVLSALAMSDAVARGIAGRLCERVPPRILLAAGMVSQAAGDLVLIVARDAPLQYITALLVGCGCGLTYVAGNVMMIETFGHRRGSALLSVAWLLSTVASIGPFVAGLAIDRIGSIAPVFLVHAALFTGLAFALLFRARPAPWPAGVSATERSAP